MRNYCKPGFRVLTIIKDMAPSAVFVSALGPLNLYIHSLGAAEADAVVQVRLAAESLMRLGSSHLNLRFRVIGRYGTGGGRLLSS